MDVCWVRHVTLLWPWNGSLVEDSGVQWENYMFDLQTEEEWKAVMSRGANERTQMNSMAILLVKCESDKSRVVNQDLAWITHGTEQQQRERAAGVKALHSMLAATASGRAKKLVKQGVAERNGMVALGRIRDRFGKTAGVAKLTDVFMGLQRESGRQVDAVGETHESGGHYTTW